MICMLATGAVGGFTAPGRPAPGPAEVYVKATAGYAARFKNLTGDTLRAMESEGAPTFPTPTPDP